VSGGIGEWNDDAGEILAVFFEGVELCEAHVCGLIGALELGLLFL
jgi:hypothetical protein